MMAFKTLVLASILSSLPATFAVPDVTVKALLDGCASYPAYNSDTGVAGPWVLQTVNNDNPAIEGFYDTSIYSIAFNGEPSLRWGSITFPTNNAIAKTALQCVNSTLQALVPNDLTAAGAPTNSQWTPLVLSPYPYDAELMWKISGGVPVQIFEHYVGDEKQNGVFLGGYENATTWGFKYYPADSGSSGLDYYLIRLLPTGQALESNETAGFIRVGA